jgi:hypothetical protein
MCFSGIESYKEITFSSRKLILDIHVMMKGLLWTENSNEMWRSLLSSWHGAVQGRCSDSADYSEQNSNSRAQVIRPF